MLTIQCENCGTMRDMTNEQVMKAAKNPQNIPRCKDDDGIMWPLGADKPSPKMAKVCSDSAEKILTENVEKTAIQEAIKLLADYLGEFPEHDQGDFRVWKASQILQRAMLIDKDKERRESR